MTMNTDKKHPRHPKELEEKFTKPFKQGGLGMVRDEDKRHIAHLSSWILTASNGEIEKWYPTVSHSWTKDLSGNIDELPIQLKTVKEVN